jgi:hypothetical protein
MNLVLFVNLKSRTRTKAREGSCSCLVGWSKSAILKDKFCDFLQEAKTKFFLTPQAFPSFFL